MEIYKKIYDSIYTIIYSYGANRTFDIFIS